MSMQITTVMYNDKEYTLKTPIEIDCGRCGKQYVLSNDVFRLLAMSDDLESCKQTIVEEVNMLIDSYLNEPNYALTKDAIVFRDGLKRRIGLT